jgi:hypothetical protein
MAMSSRPIRFPSVIYIYILRRIFGSKMGEVTGEWRKLHNEELNDLYSSRNISRVIKSKSKRWAGRIARMRERRNICRVLVGSLMERGHFGDPGVNGRIII